MRTLIVFDPGPLWIVGEPANRQDRAVIGRHLVRMRELFDEGSLIFGGPTSEGFGGVALIEAQTAQDAKTLMDADPAVVAGILTFRIMPLNPYFDAFSGRAWSAPATS